MDKMPHQSTEDLLTQRDHFKNVYKVTNEHSLEEWFVILRKLYYLQGKQAEKCRILSYASICQSL